MAERRMFTKQIIDSDAFLDMPMSAQALYFHLSMRADDDGFVNNPKKVQRMVGASDDDCKILLAKHFIYAFESGIIVIKHWRMHNLIRKDRYHPTQYQEELSELTLKENGAYTKADNQLTTTCQPLDNQRLTEGSIGKVSLGQYRREGVYGRFENVTLSPEEYKDVCDKGYADLIEEMSEAIKSQRFSTESCYASLLSWGRRRDAYKKDGGKLKSKPSFDIDEIAKKAKLNEEYEI